MAQKKSTRKSSPKSKSRARSRSKPQPTLYEQLRVTVLRPEVIGVILVLVSAFTLLSLVTNSRGILTSAWIDTLQQLVGSGVWGVPLVIGILGLWMIIHAIERMEDVPWQRPAGFALLLLAYVIGTTLLLPRNSRALIANEGEAGGMVGLVLANGLEDALSLWGAWTFTTFLTIAGLIFLTDRLLVDAVYDGWERLLDWWEDRKNRSTMPPIHPETPLPSGKLPLWKRMMENFHQPGEQSGRSRSSTPPGKMILPNADVSFSNPSGAQQTSQEILRDHAQSQGDKPPETGMSPNTQPATQVVAEGGMLKPRIVGSSQQWQLPPINEILNEWERHVDGDDEIRHQGKLIQDTLALFGVPADFEGAFKGPAVTQYLIKPGYVERTIKGETKRTKVKVSKISGLANDLALALAASSVRIEAPIPGTSYIGVEVPNQESNIVGLKELMESESFQELKGKLRIALGEDVKGQSIVADLTRMPHLLIAGATGTGKSACINSIISALLLTHTPDSLRMLMVDPKMVELSTYNGIPHLLSPVVTEVDKAAGVLFWAVKEMERRYQLCSRANARDLVRYNEYLTKRGEKPLPYIVVIIDEMADLMMAAPEEVEKHVCRLAQMARAIGIHLIIATQRPSVDVITGLIKANFPARISLAVTSQTDSRVILDIPGAERLLGKGDMLFMSPDASKLERLQGTWVGDDEINNLVRYWKGVRSFEDYEQEISIEDEFVDPITKIQFDDGSFSATPVTKATIAEETESASSQLDPTNRSTQESISEGHMSRAAVTTPTNTPQLTPKSTAMSSTRSYGAPPEQPPLFEEIESLQAADARDKLFEDAVRIVQEAGRGSTSLLQRKLRIGYNRSCRLLDELEEAGILGPDQEGSRGRPLLIQEQPEQIDHSLAPRIIGGEESDPDTSKQPRIWM